MVLEAVVKSIRHSLEPLIVMFVIASMLQMPVIQQYVYKKFSEDKHFVYEYTNDSSTCGFSIKNPAQQDLQDEVQSSMARYFIGLIFCWTLATVISCFFYGALSDRIGRRIIITINCIGSCIDASLMLVGMYLDFSVYIFYAGVLINGISGAYNGLFMISYAYVADVTEKKNLPTRLGILECTSLVAACASFYSSGPFIQAYGFNGAQMLIASLYFASTLYIIFVIKESLKKENTVSFEMKEALTGENVGKLNQNRTGLKDFLQDIMQQPKMLWRTCTKARPKRWAFFLCIVILTLVSAFTIGMYMMITLYLMNRPFCLPPLEIGKYLGTQMVVIAAGTFIGMKLLLKVPRYLVALMSPISAIVGYIIFASAKTTSMAYAALAGRAFSALHVPIFRATLSEIAGPTEQGAMFSVVTVVETIIMFIASFLFNFSYDELNKIGKTKLFFYIPTGLLLIPVVMIGLFWFHWSKESDEKSFENDFPDRENNVVDWIHAKSSFFV